MTKTINFDDAWQAVEESEKNAMGWTEGSGMNKGETICFKWGAHAVTMCMRSALARLLSQEVKDEKPDDSPTDS